MDDTKLFDEIENSPSPTVEPRKPKQTIEELNQTPLKLSARQFVRARQYRWERSAGFLYECREKFGAEERKTVDEWQPIWDAFWQRIV